MGQTRLLTIVIPRWARPPGHVLHTEKVLADGRKLVKANRMKACRTNDSVSKPNGGTCNVVFVDASVRKVRSALGDDPSDKSQMEYGKYEKYGCPHSRPP